MEETIVHDPRLLWPDTLSLATNGYLYITANQLHSQGRFHNGEDLRRKPLRVVPYTCKCPACFATVV
jgi:hypothetical protein